MLGNSLSLPCQGSDGGPAHRGSFKGPAMSAVPSQCADCWCPCCWPQRGSSIPRKERQDRGECSQVDGSVTQRSCPSYGGPRPLACSPMVENAVLLILPSSSSAPQRAASQPQHQQATCCGQVLWSLWFQRVSSAELGRRAYQEIRQTCRQQGSCCVNPPLLLISCV